MYTFQAAARRFSKLLPAASNPKYSLVRLLIRVSKRLIYAAVTYLKSATFGKNRRIILFMFSFVPRSYALYGWQ